MRIVDWPEPAIQCLPGLCFKRPFYQGWDRDGWDRDEYGREVRCCAGRIVGSPLAEQGARSKCGRRTPLQGRDPLLEAPGHQRTRTGERCPVLFLVFKGRDRWSRPHTLVESRVGSGTAVLGSWLRGERAGRQHGMCSGVTACRGADGPVGVRPAIASVRSLLGWLTRPWGSVNVWRGRLGFPTYAASHDLAVTTTGCVRPRFGLK